MAIAAESNAIHPMRWMRTRPFALKAVQKYARDCGRALPTPENMQTMLDIVVSHFDALPFERRADASVALFNQEMSIAMHVGRYATHGRNVFLLSPGLVEAFDNTDLDGVRIADVKLPHESLYMSFGDAFEGSLAGPPNRIDGAYVSQSTDARMQIVVTSRRTDIRDDDARAWPQSREPYYNAPLDVSDPERTFDSAIQEALAAAEIKTQFDGGKPERALADVFQRDGRTVSVFDVRGRTERLLAEQASAGLPLFRRALGIVVNALCYLNSEREEDNDKPAIFPADAPPDLTNLALGDLGQKSAAASIELLKRGYTRVCLLGGKLRRLSDHEGAGASPVAHTRRGHWRLQPHGPERALRRRIWIKPMLVRGDLGDAAAGRVYNVS